MSDLTNDANEIMKPPPRLSMPAGFTVPPPDQRTGERRRGPGRPPGRKNRPKEPDGGINPPSTMRIPPGTNRNPLDDKKQDDTTDADRKRKEKQERAEEYSRKIKEDLNDKLFMLIIGATSIPAEALFKAGKVPAKAATNPDYTEFGNQIAIPSDVADSWGKLLAELSYTDAGKSLTKAVENEWLVLLFAFAGAAFSTYRYTQQLQPILQMVKMQREAQAKAAQEAANKEDGAE